MTLAVSFLFLFLTTMSCNGDREDALSLHRERCSRNGVRSFEFGADRTRQRETKAEIRESKHCNWRRDRRKTTTNRDEGTHTGGDGENREGVEEA